MKGKVVVREWWQRDPFFAPFGRLKELADMIDAALDQARGETRAQLKCCVEFTRKIIKCWEETEGMLDGADVQECLLSAGVLVETQYDPAIHGEQDAAPGDPWNVFSPAYDAVRALEGK